MRVHEKISAVAMATTMMVTLVGCGGEDKNGVHDIYFMGAVIDGATGAPLTAYDIALVYGNNKRVAGKVDPATGRYTVGPLPAWNDYGVLITAGDGYRAFSSYNSGIAPPAPPTTSLSADIYSANTTQTFDFDAYVFPTSVMAPDLHIAILESGPNTMPAAGSIRVQPTTQPVIQSQASEVATQVWANDQDIFAAGISGTFTNGSYMVPGPMLVYGVNYQVTVYGVDGFQPGSGTVQAGVTSQATVTVSPQTVPPLQLVASTATACHPPTALTDTASAQVSFTFNAAIEDGTTTTGKGPEILDNGLQIFDSTSGSSLATNSSSTVSERGTSFTISGNTLSISWNPNVGLSIKGTGDTILDVTYSGLSSIYLQPIGHPELRVTLYQLLNFTSSITCQ